jgi:serine phosphatase RsbU (regulator of sigma subunit)
MGLFLDIGTSLVPKSHGSVSGDCIEIVTQDDYACVVLADGFGSGEKALAASSLTARTIIKMLGCNSTLEDIVHTVTHFDYSTFSFLEITACQAHLVECDNPLAITGLGETIIDIPRFSRSISNKKVSECDLILETGHWIVMFSDGVLNAGKGRDINSGWTRTRLEKYITRLIPTVQNALDLANEICRTCKQLSGNRIQDDIAVAAIMAGRQ